MDTGSAWMRIGWREGREGRARKRGTNSSTPAICHGVLYVVVVVVGGVLDVSYLPLMAARVIRAEDKRARNKIRTGSGTGRDFLTLCCHLSLSLCFFVCSREKGNVSSEPCDLMTLWEKCRKSGREIRGTRSIWREREKKIFRDISTNDSVNIAFFKFFFESNFVFAVSRDWRGGEGRENNFVILELSVKRVPSSS